MNPPNETIYINNLPDKMKKEDLKMSLYHLFSQFGAIVDIVAMKTPHTRGQAFVIYRNVQNATTALKALQGFTFFKRELRIAYAKVKSEAIERLEGTFKKKNAKLRRREREAKEREHIKCIEGKAVGGIEEGKSSKRAGTALDAPPAKRSKQDLGEPNATLLLSNFPRAILKQPGALKVWVCRRPHAHILIQRTHRPSSPRSPD